MALSTPIPIAMAEMVMVIKSSGIFISPIMPRINIDGKVLGISAKIDKLTDLNINKNMIKITEKTTAMVLICESNKLCNMLLYSTSMPVV